MAAILDYLQGAVAMHILCPHCQNPIELVRLTREEILCPSCGSSFCLAEEATTSWEKRRGQRLGKFELVETVGQGAFGTVYKARDTELDRTVAIKVPRLPAGINPAARDDLDRFLREARSVAQLRHESIVSIHEVGQQDGLPYLVSDFVEGTTLADVLTARQLSFRESAELVAAVADALQYAHDHGVVHRDVKPSNIMLENPSPGPLPEAERGSPLLPPSRFGKGGRGVRFPPPHGLRPGQTRRG
jgi:serine/threonine protein kinase